MKFTCKKTTNLFLIIIISIISSFLLSDIAAASTPPDPSDYTINRIPGDFIDISGTGFSLTLGNQQGISGIPIGFDFHFYGISYNTCTITSNGYMTFSTLVGNMNTPLPTTQLPDNIIAPFWDYLDPSLSSASGVYFETRGTSPHRIFIVQWDNVPLASDPLSALTFEIILFEENNEIQFHYSAMTNGYSQDPEGPAAGSSASIGIENADGTRGKEVSFNRDGIVTGGTAFSFTLAGNAFETGRLLGDLDNDDEITILDQSVITDIIAESGVSHTSTELLLSDLAPQNGTEERAFGDGIIDASDHDTIFQVVMGRQELNPVLSGISLFIAPPGETIILYGSGFNCENSQNNVIFTDVDSDVINVVPDAILAGCSELVVTVPDGLDFITFVQVEKNSLVSNKIPFYLEGTPVITELSPDGGQPGDIIRVKGYEFGFAAGDNLVRINGISATVTGVNTANFPQELSVRVPANVSTGPLTVTVGGNTSNELIFTSDGPPVVSIDSPASGSEITGPVDIVGTAFDYHLTSYTLEYVPAGETEFISLGSGTSSVSGEVLGHFDPTMLLNGLYTIRLTAVDDDGYTSIVSATYTVKGEMKIGHFTVSFTDLEVPVAGMPISITRTYDSRDKRKGDFGYGWSLGVNSVNAETNGAIGQGWHETVISGPISNYCIDASRVHIVTIRFPNDKVYEFTPVISPSCQIVPIQAVHISYVPRSGTNAALTTNYDTLNPGYYNVLVASGASDGIHLVDYEYNDYNPTVYNLTLPDGREFSIHTTHGIQSITDTNGNKLILTANGITSINEAVPGSSKGVAFERDAEGRITGIFDPAGNGMSYTYDAAGDLIAFTDREDNTTQFGYHPDFPHYLERIIDPLGRTPVKNEYYDDGRLKSHTDANGNTITYNHNINSKQEIITDRLGNIHVLQFDDKGNIIREAQPDGMVIDRQFDDRNNLIYETKSYDPVNPPAPVPATRYEYDENNNLLWVENELNHRTEFTYNERNKVLTMVDPLGNWTINVYDNKGNITGTEIREGAEDGPVVSRTGCTYNQRGKIITQTVLLDGEELVKQYEYNSYGNMSKEIDVSGNETAYTSDSNGNRLTEVASRTVYTCSDDGCVPSDTESLATNFEYNKMGKILKLFDPGDPVDVYTEIVYDALGRQIETYDKMRRKIVYEYDRYEDSIRWDRITFPDSTYEEKGFNAENHCVKQRDRAGRITDFEYDAMGRLVKTIYPPSTAGGQRTETENHYNAAGLLASTEDALGNVIEYEYDKAGQRILMRQYLGNEPVETTYAYDANGNQTSITDAMGNTTTYEYNVLNQNIKTIYPPEQDGAGQLFTETTYDTLGRRIAECDQDGKITQFEYDALGHLVKVTTIDNGEENITLYRYDEAGNLITQTDAEGRTTWFQYDQQGREIARLLPAINGISAKETKSYYNDGKLAAHTDFMGRTTIFTYTNILGELESKTYENGESIAYTYTSTGRVAGITDKHGTTTYNFNDCDQITSIIYPTGNSLEYSYDLLGNTTSLTAKIGTTGLTTSYSYDSLNRLDTVTDPVNRQFNYNYDKNGNRVVLSYPNGIRTDYTYDNLNRLTSLVTERLSTSTQIQSYQYTLGKSGNRIQINEYNQASGEHTIKYQYDDLYRLTGESVLDPDNNEIYEKFFVYDKVGNRLQQTTVPGSSAPAGIEEGIINSTYDSRDRLQTNEGLTYIWDENGNLISTSGNDTYTWDVENRLIRVTKSDGTVIEYDYDSSGNRIQSRTIIPGQDEEVINYLIDPLNALSNVVAETDNDNNLLAFYVRGDDLLSVMRPDSDEWNTRFYHTDGIGSVRVLTEESGVATDDYTYTAFGELVEHIGPDPQPYAFAGEPLDVNSGFQYHRARWMDPGNGRWLSMDIWDPVLNDPASLHKYLYAYDGPVNNSDPTGHFTLIGMSIGSMIQNICSAARITWHFEKANSMVDSLVTVGAFMTIIGHFMGIPYNNGNAAVTIRLWDYTMHRWPDIEYSVSTKEKGPSFKLKLIEGNYSTEINLSKDELKIGAGYKLKREKVYRLIVKFIFAIEIKGGSIFRKSWAGSNGVYVGANFEFKITHTIPFIKGNEEGTSDDYGLSFKTPDIIFEL